MAGDTQREGGAFEAGRAAWPDVALDAQTFEAYLREREAPPEHFSDLFLACACLQGNLRALEHLESEFLSKIPEMLRGTEKRASAVDEVTQAVREALLVDGRSARAKLHEYSGRGSLRSWLRVIAVRVALRQRKREEEREGSLEPEELRTSSSRSPEAGALKARYRDQLNRALEDAVADLSSAERTTLRLYYLEGLTLEQIAAIMGVVPSTISRRMTTACRAVMARMETLLRERLQISAGEMSSLIRLLHSQLDVHLRQTLDKAPP